MEAPFYQKPILVKERVYNEGKSVYQHLYRCACGKQFKTRPRNVEKGIIVSCGCRKVKQLTKHGLRYTPEYKVWRAMLTRCLNKNCPAYSGYGGRGITVCAQWLKDYTRFYSDMGPRPNNDYSLDRINNNGNYEPSNCRWATRSQQQRNKNPYKRKKK